MAIKSTIASSARVIAGGVQHRLTGRTPPSAYQSLIRLYCLTRGQSNDLISSLLARMHRPVDLGQMDGILGNLDSLEFDRITHALDDKGYFVFDRRLPADICDRLLKFA